MVTDESIIKAFVASFQSDQFFTHDKPPPWELNSGIDPDDWNCLLWKPMPTATSSKELNTVYEKLGAKFPPLYEQLVLSWRWLDVWLGGIRLFANPPGSTLEPLCQKMLADASFHQHLVAEGYIPFALDIDRYDPICFDARYVLLDGDCAIRKFEHEAILCSNRIGDSQILWPSSRAMMLKLGS